MASFMCLMQFGVRAWRGQSLSSTRCALQLSVALVIVLKLLPLAGVEGMTINFNYVCVHVGGCLKERLRILCKVAIIIFAACFLLFGMRRGPRLGK